MTPSRYTPGSPDLHDGLGQDFDPFAFGAIAGVIPSTEAQREVWLAHQLGSEASLAYNESVDLALDGPLDPAALHAALVALVARHDALRASFSLDGTELIVVEAGDFELPLHDLSGLAAEARDQAMAAAHAEAVETPFDLERGPLLRAALYRHTPTRHVLLLTAHHTVCDGWSWGVIADELGQLYAEQTGQGPALEPAPSYGDYANWAREEAETPAARAQLAYWLGRYPEATLPTLELPLDRARPARRRFNARRLDVLLPAALAEAARQQGARAGVSLFATLFSLFAALMHRLSQQDDLVIGVPVAGQAASDMPRLVGHCVNLLPVRVAVEASQPVETLLKTVGGTLLDAFEHQTLTYGALLKKLPVARDPSRPSLVSVMFNLDRAPASPGGTFPGLHSTLSGNPRHFENFELFLNVVPVADGLMLELQYNTTLFDERTVRRWLALYTTALERLTRTPGASVAEALACSADDVALLRSFNATAAPFDAQLRIDALIARQAEATPEALAVRAGGASLSYRELDRRANGLAAALQAQGIGPGDLVGLCCGRNAHMLVALVGILKSGAGYVPLDPAFPRERLEFMTGDAQLRVAVTDADTDGAAPLQALARVRADQVAPADAAPGHAGDAEAVAYVIYTSGSTGRPKGVRVPHRSVLNLLTSLRSVPGIDAQRRVLAVTTLSFDIAVSEVILPLTVGACIVVADKTQAMQGDRLRALIETEEVDFVDATPSTWRILLDAGWPGRRDLLAICTGEPLPGDLARQLLPMVGELWNGYGPTETTVWSSFHRVLQADGVIPIGRPIANTEFHVLDAALRPLPVGVTGELYIGGAGVTLGYLNRPELTEQRFVPVPGAPAGAARWYRTGDLGRWRADGVLECLGRADDQVKVRGYRIELGEIESNLARHAGVDRALVVTREDAPGDVRIVAYVVPRGPMPEAAALRQHLAAFLPEYMLPQHFVALAALPLLPNGKVNRQALPAPQSAVATRSAAAVPPRDELEQQILTVMEQTLSLPGLGIEDDFFALGGHSLLAARFTARLGRELQLKLPMSMLFEAPTVERIAQAVRRLRGEGQSEAQAPIVAQRDRRSAPLTPMQERILFLEELHPGRPVYNAPSGHRFLGPLDIEKFRAALREMVQRHGALRTAMGRDATGAPVQTIAAHVDFEVPLVDLSTLPEDEREAELMRRMQQLADQPLDIHRAPLFHMALYRMGPEDHGFMFVPHHLIWDGWSFDIYQAELSALYGARVRGRPHTLPEPPVAMGDYAQWYADWMQQPDFARQLDFWKQRFARMPAPRAARTDMPRKAGMSGNGGVNWIHIDPAATQRLREVARRHDVTLSMLTLGAYVLMMSSAIDSPSVVIATPVRGREAPELESVMGFFNNVLPLPFQVDAGQDFGTFIRYVKQELVAVMRYQQIPFERLATEPEFVRLAQGAGLYQGLFSFQDARERPHDFGGLTHKQVHLLQRGATDDLGLWLLEKPQGLEGPIAYNADIYLPETGTAFRDRFVEILRTIAERPDVPLAALLAPEDSASARILRRLSSSAEAAPVEPRAPGATALLPAQAQLAEVWAQVLNIDIGDIRAGDNFFDLGGDSLLAMRVVQQSEQSLGLRIEPRRYMFESLAQLAATEAEAVTEGGAEAGAAAAEAPRGGLLNRMFSGWGRKP
ncbi:MULTISPECIES: non-ribosomal peptide synthetase [unclassified Variovorax]|uniref:non-ribosomal peptide synthetase n=1 Tax=unclassified Variovorax TaxID=663243 RepID=UPI00257814AE|nr:MULTISPECIES: non-ribosomal peptide synthetase [unclassified Variovorax]MDM0091133.1 amino acid adenylation domain-containing protein [Variovorax sp. J22G40]MDM0148865.1 amino acid adenylation domain-containing protein [Variovorax sp. J2P1-31]